MSSTEAATPSCAVGDRTSAAVGPGCTPPVHDTGLRVMPPPPHADWSCAGAVRGQPGAVAVTARACGSDVVAVSGWWSSGAAVRDERALMEAAALEKEAEMVDEWVGRCDSPSSQHLRESRDGGGAAGRGVEADTAARPRALAPTTTAGQPSDPPRATLCGFFSADNLRVATVPFVCGCLSGYTVGYVGIYTQLYNMSTNCALYSAKTACESVPFADCVWYSPSPTLQYCGWPSITCRAAYPSSAWVGGGGDTALAEAQCLRDARCSWAYAAAECRNPFGFSASYTGLFAGSIIAGSMCGALLGGPVVVSAGTRLTFTLCGVFCLACSAMAHVDAATDELWVLVVGRFVVGVFTGLLTVACPLYVNTNADTLYRRKLGTLFQVFTTLGVLLTASIGLGVGETVEYAAERDARLSWRIQGLVSGQTALSLALIALGVWGSEGKVRYTTAAKDAMPVPSSGSGGGGGGCTLNQNEYSYREMLGPLLMTIVVNGTMRFTGFNAILNFAPTILGGLGLSPLEGNMYIMIINFVGTLLSIPLDSFVSIRSIFLFGSAAASCVCLFLCGVPVYPGVASERATNACAVAGIALFVFVFEVFVGPSFYVLLQDMFPPSFRPRGNSFGQLWQFVINLVINVCYPIATERLSGGPAGNQHKGQAIVFIFFGGLGLVCFILEMLFLKVWEEETPHRRGGGAAAADAEPTAATPAPSVHRGRGGGGA
ncbi:glucose transporter 2 [Novymonas esmeraldas]|uniref:Glucose transporter 2 n=1 Tax=Novymonas esmeraldas TaxID=1808958 RepID=A0AAW0EZ04_9TRYP